KKGAGTLAGSGRKKCLPPFFGRRSPGRKGARGRKLGEDGPLHKGSLLMAAPSGLTRFTTALCVGPLPVSHRGRRVITGQGRLPACPTSLIVAAGSLFVYLFRLDRHLVDDHRFQRPLLALFVFLHRLCEYFTGHVQPPGDLAEDRVVAVEE